MGAGFAEHLDHQVGGAVDGLRDLDEIGCDVDVAAQAHDLGDAVEIAVEGGAGVGEDVERRQPRGGLRVLEIELAADLADIADLAVPARQLPGYEQEAARDLGHLDACRARPRRRGERDAELAQAFVDAAHGRPPVFALGDAMPWHRLRCTAAVAVLIRSDTCADQGRSDP